MSLKLDNGRGEKVIDNYNSIEKWDNFESNPMLEGISKTSSDIIVKYIMDMKKGVNISNRSIRGARGYRRLNDIRVGMGRLIRLMEKHLGIIDITQITEEQLIDFFDMIRTGKIKKENGTGKYKSAEDWSKNFKAFWHWYMKYSKKKIGKIISDITEDLSIKREKPEFHYFTFEQLKDMAEQSKYEYKVLQYFLFDSGARPQEALNSKAKDFTDVENSEFLYYNIRDEVAKTFGRKIKLMISHNLIRNYIKNKKIKPDDFLFTFKPRIVNEYLNRIGHKVLSLGRKEDKKKWISDGLIMYDYRHSSACYWTPRYKNESALKYRFGWKKENMITYYTEFLGMKDTIQQEDMLIDTTRTELEKELEQQRGQNQIMEERLSTLEKQQKTIELFEKLLKKKGIDFEKMIKI